MGGADTILLAASFVLSLSFASCPCLCCHQQVRPACTCILSILAMIVLAPYDSVGTHRSLQTSLSKYSAYHSGSFRHGKRVSEQSRGETAASPCCVCLAEHGRCPVNKGISTTSLLKRSNPWTGIRFSQDSQNSPDCA